eukprot:5067688-Alexandrium_andersonii.AAC.1
MQSPLPPSVAAARPTDASRRQGQAADPIATTMQADWPDRVNEMQKASLDRPDGGRRLRQKGVQDRHHCDGVTAADREQA